MRKTTKRKTSTGKKAAAGKPVRKVMRKATRKAVPKRAPKRTMRKTMTTRAGGAKLWTAAEVKLLKNAYKNTSTTDIAKKLKRSLSSVRSKAVALSLKKAAPRKTAVRRKTRRR